MSKNAVPLFYSAAFGVCLFAGFAKGEDNASNGSPGFAALSVFEFCIFFALVSVSNVLRHHKKYYMFVKPLPIFFLIQHIALQASTFASQLILAGLCFGVLGDMWLVFRQRWRPSLIIGAWMFFFGHLCYLFAYYATPISAGKEIWLTWFGLFLIFMHEYYYFMLKNAPFLEFVFGLLYWTGISVMFVAAVNAQHYIWTATVTNFPFAFAGSFLFVLSDLCIHWSIYVDPANQLAERMILPLYYVGQLFIMQSAGSLGALGF